MRISIELVPRDEGTLLRDAVLLRDRFPCVNQLNIPDLLRFPLRSWEACRLTHAHFPVSIPHVRAIDLPGDGDLCEVEQILGKGFSEVLVVSGDQPQGGARRGGGDRGEGLPGGVWGRRPPAARRRSAAGCDQRGDGDSSPETRVA